MKKGLVYGGAREKWCNQEIVQGFVDSNYAVCVDTRKPLIGYVFTAFGTTISWKATFQKVVALSTTEVEYISMTEAAKEALGLIGLIKELGVMQEIITVYYDNQSAIQLSKNQVFYERTKHIDVKLHFIREELSKGSVNIHKISTDENPSDMITKSLLSSKFDHCLELIGLKES